MDEASRRARRRHAEVRVFRPFAEHDAADARWWRAQPVSVRLLERGGSAKSSGACSDGSRINPDFVDLLRAFVPADVRFLVVGAYALAVHIRS